MWGVGYGLWGMSEGRGRGVGVEWSWKDSWLARGDKRREARRKRGEVRRGCEQVRRRSEKGVRKPC